MNASSSARILNVAVVGAGHLGKEHARIYAQLHNTKLKYVCDVSQSRAVEIAEKHGAKPLSDFREIAGVDAVSIVVPTVDHHRVAKYFLERGVHVLVEKPMTKTLAEADELVKIAGEKKLKLQVGHVERFNPALMAARKYTRHPKFIESYRISPFSFRSSDVGVVLDLMIHDLDIILHLVDSPVVSVHSIGINVLTDSEDVANTRLEFENGCIANLTASRVALKWERKVRGFFGDCYISLDYAQKKGVIYRKKVEFAAGQVGIGDVDIMQIQNIATFAFDKFIDVEEIQMDLHEPLAKELESFADCILENKAPVVSGQHGRNAMHVAVQIMEQIAERRKKFS